MDRQKSVAENLKVGVGVGKGNRGWCGEWWMKG